MSNKRRGEPFKINPKDLGTKIFINGLDSSDYKKIKEKIYSDELPKLKACMQNLYEIYISNNVIYLFQKKCGCSPYKITNKHYYFENGNFLLLSDHLFSKWKIQVVLKEQETKKCTCCGNETDFTFYKRLEKGKRIEKFDLKDKIEEILNFIKEKNIKNFEEFSNWKYQLLKNSIFGSKLKTYTKPKFINGKDLWNKVQIKDYSRSDHLNLKKKLLGLRKEEKERIMKERYQCYLSKDIPYSFIRECKCNLSYIKECSYFYFNPYESITPLEIINNIYSKELLNRVVEEKNKKSCPICKKENKLLVYKKTGENNFVEVELDDSLIKEITNFIENDFLSYEAFCEKYEKCI